MPRPRRSPARAPRSPPRPSSRSPAPSAAASDHSCAIGRPARSRAGGSTTSTRSVPPSERSPRVGGGGIHNCAIRTAGTLVCWGNNNFGQLNNIPSGTFTAISAGLATPARSAPPARSPAGATTTSASSTTSRPARSPRSAPAAATPARSAPPERSPAGETTARGQLTNVPAGLFTAVSAGDNHTCAIRAAGTLACWGNNDSVSSTTSRPARSPRYAGGDHTCAIRTAGTLACWGRNNAGQLDNIPAGTFTAVSAGESAQLRGPERRHARLLG